MRDKTKKEIYYDQVLQCFKDNISQSKIAKLFPVSLKTIHYWRKEAINNGELDKSVKRTKRVLKKRVETADIIKSETTTPIVISEAIATDLDKIDKFKDNGIDVMNDCLEKIIEKIPHENNIHRLAVVVEKIAPYVVKKADNDDSPGDTNNFFVNIADKMIENAKNAKK